MRLLQTNDLGYLLCKVELYSLSIKQCRNFNFFSISKTDMSNWNSTIDMFYYFF